MNASLNKSVVILIQARYSSQRLPGKVLHPLCDTQILGMLWRNLSALDIPKVVLTSDEISDQAIADYCYRNQITCFRGPLDNVADRFARFLKQHAYDYFIRISADSPLMDHRIPAQALELLGSQEHEVDLVTNVLKRTFPKGQSVELVNTKTFLSLQQDMTTHDHREHVTRIFYENPEKYRVINFESGGDFGHIQLSVDTPEDLNIIQRMLAMNQCTSAPWEKWVDFYQSIHRA